MKILKRILLGLVGLILVLLLAAGGAVYWVVNHPRETWAYVEKKYLPPDFKMTWEQMDFSVKSLTGWSFRFDWNIEGLQISKEKPLVDVPVQTVRLEASVYPLSPGAKLRLHQLRVLTTKPSRVVLEESKNTNEPAQNFFQLAQNVFEKVETYKNWVKTEEVHIDIKDFSLATKPGAAPFLFSFSASQNVAEAEQELFRFLANATFPGENPMEIVAKGHIRLANVNSPSPILQSDISLQGAGVKTQQKLTLVQQDKKTVLASEGQVRYQQDKIKILVTPKLNISLSPKKAVTNLRANFAGLPGPVVKVDHFEAEVVTPLENDIVWSERPSKFSAKAPVNLFFIDEDMRAPLEKSCECKIPESLLVSVQGNVWLAYLMGSPTEQRPILDVRASVQSLDNKLISSDVAADLKIEKKDASFLFYPKVDGVITINNFQGMRQFLDAKNILVPAPLSVLEGTLKLTARGPVESNKTDYSFPVVLNADLKSARQVVKVTTDSKIKMNADLKEIYVDVLAKIKDLQLVLPPLDPLKGKPRVTLDKRILKAPVKKTRKKASSTKVYFSLGVETEKPGAIRLLSELFEPYLPLTLKVEHSGKKENSGFIQTEPFNIVYLRRTVRVNHLKLDLNQLENEVLPVDAQLQIKQTNYTIFINLSGPITNPHIVFTSDPYLPESEVISVLLYDRQSHELIAADAEAAGSVKAAIADRAIGLFGLWAFASTPIKSFSYNPVTKVYSATLAITDDLTAGIGTNWEQTTQVELRKRVSRRWILTASWNPGTQDEDATTRLMLQWEKRF